VGLDFLVHLHFHCVALERCLLERHQVITRDSGFGPN
jgi:hypothetical protein